MNNGYFLLPKANKGLCDRCMDVVHVVWYKM